MKRLERWLYLSRRQLRFLFQRLTRGWDDSETWNLNQHCAGWLLPRVRRFREINPGYWHDSKTQTDAALDEVIWFLELHVSEDGTWSLVVPGDEVQSRINHDRYNKAAALFGETFGHLWW